MILKYFDLASV